MKAEPIPRKDATNIAMVNGNEATITHIIQDGMVKEWVGIGWVELREATPADYESIGELEEM